MSSLLFSLPELYQSYKRWVSENPQKASDFETTTKWISYFIAGRIHNSNVVSELVYCLSNLLVLFNDRIITKSRHLEVPSSGDKLKIWLTIIEYSEVFFELSAKKIWGNTGKWIVIVAVQIFKCISRLLLIYHHKEIIIQHPPIPVLERRILPIAVRNEFTVQELAREQMDAISFTLKRSGKVIRKISSSPPMRLRTWKPPEKVTCENDQIIEKALAGRQLVAETMYILKPIAHLIGVGISGSYTWKSWMISLAMDLTSLHIYRTCHKTKKDSLTNKQKLQISRRCVVLLLYLLRSPFYERHSKDVLNAFLLSMSKNIPLASFICIPVVKYLPFWQSNYFYMWST